MSQDELARRLGYKSRSSITKIEKDASGLPQTKIVAIANALHTTPAYIMGWDEENSSTDKAELTEGEKTLLELFRLVPEEQQDLVLNMIRGALKR